MKPLLLLVFATTAYKIEGILFSELKSGEETTGSGLIDKDEQTG